MTDPEHHRFGGLLLSGVHWDDSFGWATTPTAAVGLLVTGADACRAYIRLGADRVRETGVGRDADAFVALASEHLPEGALEGARPIGPLGFFPNSCTWSSRIAAGTHGAGGGRGGCTGSDPRARHVAPLP